MPHCQPGFSSFGFFKWLSFTEGYMVPFDEVLAQGSKQQISHQQPLTRKVSNDAFRDLLSFSPFVRICRGWYIYVRHLMLEHVVALVDRIDRLHQQLPGFAHIRLLNGHLQGDLAELSHRFSDTTASYGIVGWNWIEESP
jgi:hypothetical protein